MRAAKSAKAIETRSFVDQVLAGGTLLSIDPRTHSRLMHVHRRAKHRILGVATFGHFRFQTKSGTSLGIPTYHLI